MMKKTKLNKKDIVFGIDCDEVMRATLTSMVSIYNKEFNDNKTIDDIDDFVVENSFPLIEEKTGKKAGEWFFQDHSKELFTESKILPGVIDAVNILKKYGKVIVITYQKSYNNKFETLSWLQKHGLEPDGICFVKDKTIIHTDYLIDDNDWNFIGSNATHGILINAVYNKNKDINELLSHSNCLTMERFDSLFEFAKNYEEIKSYN